MSEDAEGRIREILAGVEDRKNLAVFDVSCELEKVRDELLSDQGELPSSYRWESIVSSLDLRPETSEWGCAFGPMMSRIDAAGNRIDSPSLESITRECLEYWQQRMAESNHPVMKARYADAVWELTEKRTGRRPPIEAARVAIDSYAASVVDIRCDPPGLDGDFLERAIKIALQINASERLEDCCRKFVDFALSCSGEEQTTTILEVFRLLLEMPSRKRPAGLLDEIAGLLRTELDRIPLEDRCHWTIEPIAIPLARYYRSKSDREGVEEVLGRYSEAVVHVSKDAAAMLAVAWLQRLYDVLTEFELHDQVRDVLNLLQRLQCGVPDEMVSHTIPMSISNEELEEWLSHIVVDDLETSIANIAFYFVPRLDEERELLADIQSKATLSSMLTTSLVDHDGRTVSTVGPVSDDPEGHFVRHLSQQMQFRDPFLQTALSRLIERFSLTGESLLGEVLRAPLWRSERVAILRRGIEAFVASDPIVAVHILIPEAESAVRTLALGLGVTVQKLDRRKRGYMLKNLDDLLREERVVLVLGEELVTYFRTVLTDQRGRNLRNDICHGIKEAEQLGELTAARIMHVILVLGMIRLTETESKGAGSQDNSTEESGTAIPVVAESEWPSDMPLAREEMYGEDGR